jgi:hypothetical protein
LYGKGGSEREIKLAMKYVYEKSIWMMLNGSCVLMMTSNFRFTPF